MSVRLSATIPTNRQGIYIPAGADIEWFWELTTTNGDTIQTDPQVYRYEDPRYTWQTVTAGTLSVYYYADEDGAQRLLEAGTEVLWKCRRCSTSAWKRPSASTSGNNRRTPSAWSGWRAKRLRNS